jgi:hypothetical protein
VRARQSLSLIRVSSKVKAPKNRDRGRHAAQLRVILITMKTSLAAVIVISNLCDCFSCEDQWFFISALSALACTQALSPLIKGPGYKAISAQARPKQTLHDTIQSGLTALKMAQSEGGHQDVCDILLRYTQHSGAKVISPEQEVSEARQEEEVKKRESEKEGETNRQQQETNTQLTEVRDTCVHELSTCVCEGNGSLLQYIHCRVTIASYMHWHLWLLSNQQVMHL